MIEPIKDTCVDKPTRRQFNLNEKPNEPITGKHLASKIDHTLLKPEATEADIKKLCAEALQFQFATVCINPNYVRLAASLLQKSPVRPITVIGFPSGVLPTISKVAEVKQAIEDGAQELDMVIQLTALKEKDYSFVYDDIRQVVVASRPYPVKVILETGSLTEDQKIIGCALSKAAGAAFVKTSTGFAGSGATVADVELMRRIVGSEMGVKASGGIRTLNDALKMLDAGATRLGTSASVNIIGELQNPQMGSMPGSKPSTAAY